MINKKNFITTFFFMFKVFKRKLHISWKYKKDKHFLTFLIVLTITFLTYCSLKKKIHFIDKYNTITSYKDTINTRDNFFLGLSIVESNKNYKIRREYIVLDTSDKKIDTIKLYSQYWGLYQLGQSARQACGYGDIDADEYLNNPKLQNKIMLIWIKHLRKELKTYITLYDKKYIKNVSNSPIKNSNKGLLYITESGIIAMAHLCGIGSVKQFFNEPNYYPVDGNNVSGVVYLLQFNRYNLNLDN